MDGIVLLRPLVELYISAGRIRVWAEEVLAVLETGGGLRPEQSGSDPGLSWGYSAGPALPRDWPLETGRWILSSEIGYSLVRLPPGFAPAGFIPAFTDPEAAADAVRTMARGFSVFPGEEDASSGGRPGEAGERDALSPQERRVLDELARGESNKRIAFLLGLSESTVRFHVSNLFVKLGAQNRAEAVYRAIGRGLLAV